MKTLPYMGKEEFISFLKVGTLCGELQEIIKHTSNKKWLQKFKTCETYIDNIIMERLRMLDKKQLDSVERRRKTTTLIMRTEDQERVAKVEKEIVSVDVNDLEELAELSLNSCSVCKEGLIVENCRFRLVYHRLGIQPCSCDPVTGQCEFKMR